MALEEEKEEEEDTPNNAANNHTSDSVSPVGNDLESSPHDSIDIDRTINAADRITPENITEISPSSLLHHENDHLVLPIHANTTPSAPQSNDPILSSHDDNIDESSTHQNPIPTATAAPNVTEIPPLFNAQKDDDSFENKVHAKDESNPPCQSSDSDSR